MGYGHPAGDPRLRDARGEHPASRPVTPADLFRTVLHQLGIGTTQLTTAGLPLQGEVIEELV